MADEKKSETSNKAETSKSTSKKNQNSADDMKPPEKNLKKRPKTLSTVELSNIESRFRERQNRYKTKIRHPQKKPDKKQNFFIIAAVFIVFSLIAAFFLNSVLNSGPDEAREIIRGERIPLIGDDAVLLPGCREVNDSHYASLSGLALGSETGLQVQKQVSQDLNLPIEIANSSGIRFRLIPHGTYIMGSSLVTDSEHRVDEDAHVVVIKKPFYIGKYEISQEEYKRVTGLAPSPRTFKGPRRPIEEVSWEDTQNFIKVLGEKEGHKINPYRLPHEKEWEYACRAGTQTPYYFAERNAFHKFALNSKSGHEVVGMRQPNAWGVHNMHGNVWEWCENPFYDYQTNEIDEFDFKSDNGSGVRTFRGHYKSIRGGNWKLKIEDCRAASRYRYPSRTLSNLLGFRIMMEIPDDLLKKD